MVCINRRSNGMNVWLSADANCDCEIPSQTAHPMHDDPPTKCYEYGGHALAPEGGPLSTQTRHYDATEGRWLSEDPIGYQPSDDATFRYPGNAPE
jgi:RHS repeat-associated protein